MAAEEKTIYELVTDHFIVDKIFNLKDRYVFQENGYRASIASEAPNFINFAKGSGKELLDDSPPRDRSQFGQAVVRYVLKFHISIPEDDEKLQKKAFDLLIPILMEHGVNFKFLRKSLKMSDAPGQTGKDITIFTNTRLDKNLEDWEKLITEITSTLVQHNIPPGYRVNLNLKGEPEAEIKGCKYVTYRYEKVKNRRNWPNPDLVGDIVINVPNQPEPRAYIAPSAPKDDKMGLSMSSFGLNK